MASRSRERFELIVALIRFSAEEQESAVSLQEVQTLVSQLKDRPVEGGFHERHIDQVMLGACLVIEAACNYHPEWKSEIGPDLIPILYSRLFSIPTFGEGEGTAYWQTRTVTDDAPQCKTVETRAAAFDALAQCVEGCESNMSLLLPLLYDRTSSLRPQDKWCYSSEDAGKSESGHVGLVNLKNICYLNSLMQQLRMISPLRQGVLGTEDPAAGENSFLSQLQRMFGSLQMSKRKAYDPTGFCMAMKDFDGNPVDVRIQQDMTEFFNQLDNNLEECVRLETGD